MYVLEYRKTVYIKMFEQIFKNIDDVLRKDSGCSTELDYAEQTSWILFLKWLDDNEKEKEIKAKLDNKTYKSFLTKEFQWSSWAVVKTKDGKVDFNKNLTGTDLKKFVDNKLFPYLSSFKNKAESINTLEYKIGEIFFELKNKLQDGYTLRDVLNAVDNLAFNSNKQKYELSALYEQKIQNMGNAGRNGGEYYTPRPLIKSIVKVIDPKVGEIIYDSAAGSCGFLVEAFEHIQKSTSLTTSQLKILQTKTFYGVEKKSLAYVIGIMNMILHGIESPNIIHQNTLANNILEIQNKDKVDVVLANPPFGGKEKVNIQENFPIKTSETALLFLQHIIKKLKNGGRAGVVIKNTFLSTIDNASINIRKQLIKECNLHCILDLPNKVFQGVDQKTVVLFFEKGKQTKKIWYYQLNLKNNLGKRNPLIEEDLDEFIKFYKNLTISSNSWIFDINNINKNYDLSLLNPNKKEEIIQIHESNIFLKRLNDLNSEFLKKSKILDSFVKNNFLNKFKWSTVGKECEFYNGKPHEKNISKNGKYCVVNSKFISTDGETRKYTDTQFFKLIVGDVVIVMSDVPNGKALAKTYLIEKNNFYSLNQRIGCLRSKFYIPEFLKIILNRNAHYLKFNNGENQTNLRKDDVLSCPVPLISFKEQNLFITEYNKFNKLKKEILEINFEKFDLIKNVNNILIHKNTNNE